MIEDHASCHRYEIVLFNGLPSLDGLIASFHVNLCDCPTIPVVEDKHTGLTVDAMRTSNDCIFKLRFLKPHSWRRWSCVAWLDIGLKQGRSYHKARVYKARAPNEPIAKNVLVLIHVWCTPVCYWLQLSRYVKYPITQLSVWILFESINVVVLIINIHWLNRYVTWLSVDLFIWNLLH
jgi:hypothetical protein